MAAASWKERSRARQLLAGRRGAECSGGGAGARGAESGTQTREEEAEVNVYTGQISPEV